MCDVASLAIGGLGIASSATGYVGQMQQAAANAKYQNKVYAETGRLAKLNYYNQIGQTQLRNDQERQALGQAALQNRVEAGSAVGQAVTIAGESGLSGNSVDALLADYERIEATNNFTLQTNQQWSEQQSLQQMEGFRADATNRTTSARPAPVQTPSLLGTMLQIGTQGLSAYDLGIQHTRQGPYSGEKTSNWLYKPLNIGF